MTKTVVIHQPDFLPYLGFFHRLLSADLYIVLDNVQFLRRGWHHRDKIKTKHGESWLTIGIQKASQDTRINKIYLNENDWKQNHLNSFYLNYKNASFYNEIIPYVEKLYDKDYDKMIDFNFASIEMLLEMFNINIKIEFESTYNLSSKSNELLIELLKSVDSNKYLSGIGAKDYFDKEIFEKAKIEVVWQDFKHPTYQQVNGHFIPYLSSIDLLFNCGITESRKILRSCR